MTQRVDTVTPVGQEFNEFAYVSETICKFRSKRCLNTEINLYKEIACLTFVNRNIGELLQDSG